MPTQDELRRAQLEREILQSSPFMTRVLRGAFDEASAIPAGLLNALVHPVDTASALVGSHVDQFNKARQAFGEGRFSEAAGHGAASVLPLVGPAAANIGEELGATGDVGRALGRTTILVAPLPLAKGAKATGRAAGEVIEAVRRPELPAVRVAPRVGLRPEASRLAVEQVREGLLAPENFKRRLAKAAQDQEMLDMNWKAANRPGLRPSATGGAFNEPIGPMQSPFFRERDHMLRGNDIRRHILELLENGDLGKIDVVE